MSNIKYYLIAFNEVVRSEELPLDYLVEISKDFGNWDSKAEFVEVMANAVTNAAAFACNNDKDMMDALSVAVEISDEDFEELLEACQE